MKRQNKNFIYNAIYQILIFIVPMITTPYISRRLGVNYIGVYSYTYSIVNYFMLLSMLGINNYGARTIAKDQGNKEKMSRDFFSIYSVQLFFSIVCVILYLLLLTFYNYEYKSILSIQMIFLISVMFDINWFFFGNEKFKITISRNILIKLVSLILIFIFIKDTGDLWKYTLIMSLSSLISQIYLWFFLKKNVDFVRVKFADCLVHIKPILILFIPVLAYSIYRVMDKTMLGIFASTVELGYYESAEKIINIPIGIVAALGTVMMPHMSKKTESEIGDKIYSTFELTFFIIIPMIIGLFIISGDFSTVFFGNEYLKTGMLIKILSISILFSSIANVIRTNYLIPCKKDKIYVTSTIIGAIINLILNLIFIPKIGSYGACIGTVLAEFVVMFYQVIYTRNIIDYKKNINLFFDYLFKGIVMAIVILLIGFLISNIYLKLICQVSIAIVVYVCLNIKYLKNDFFGKEE